MIDYREADFTEAAGPVDVVLDTIGGDTLSRSLDVVREGGTIVSILPRSIRRPSRRPRSVESAWR